MRFHKPEQSPNWEKIQRGGGGAKLKRKEVKTIGKECNILQSGCSYRCA